MQAAPSPRVKTETPDYGKLYSIVNVLFDSAGAANEEKNHKQMMEQLEPVQRCAHCTAQSYLPAFLFLTKWLWRVLISAWMSQQLSTASGR